MEEDSLLFFFMSLRYRDRDTKLTSFLIFVFLIFLSSLSSNAFFCFILSMGTGYSPQSRIRTIRDSPFSGFYCCLPYPRKRRIAMPPAFSVLITYMDTRPSDSIHTLPRLRAHTCPHPHNRWSCPNTPQWRPAYFSHIPVAV